MSDRSSKSPASIFSLRTNWQRVCVCVSVWVCVCVCASLCVCVCVLKWEFQQIERSCRAVCPSIHTSVCPFLYVCLSAFLFSFICVLSIFFLYCMSFKWILSLIIKVDDDDVYLSICPSVYLDSTLLLDWKHGNLSLLGCLVLPCTCRARDRERYIMRS